MYREIEWTYNRYDAQRMKALFARSAWRRRWQFVGKLLDDAFNFTRDGPRFDARFSNRLTHF